MKNLNVLMTLGVLLLVGCQSTVPTREADSLAAKEADAIRFTDKHLDFVKWGRKNDCCSAKGMKVAIASPGERTSQAGLELYQKGCNLVDSAVATAFAMAVERPQSTGIGGGGFMTLHLAKRGDFFVDFRETAPRKATSDMYLSNGEVIPNLSRDGVNSAGTPGYVAGLWEIHKKYGSRRAGCSWKDALAPAIRMAEEGFPVYISLQEKISARSDVLLKDPEATRLLFDQNKEPLKAGQLLVQKDLAKSLRLIAKGGVNAFYKGELAKRITKFIKENARAGTPYFDETDLRKYKPRFREPLKGSYQGLDIVTAPPPSAGGVAMLEMFQILSGYALKEETSRTRQLSLLAETMRRAYADRQILGDPDFVKDQTYLKLLTPEYAEAARAHLVVGQPLPSTKVTPVEFLNPQTPPQPGKPETPHTANASLMDSEGNAIAVTTTVNYTFGAATVVPGTGIFLNDEMDDFSVKPGVQNLTGLTGSVPNSIEPGKRPLSSMVPTIVLREGKPILAIGAAGSSTIISGVFQTTLNYLVYFRNDLQKSLFAGRIHHQWLPDKLLAEKDAFSAQTEERLRKMGYVVEPPHFITQVQAVGRDAESGEFTAVHEPRDFGGALAE